MATTSPRCSFCLSPTRHGQGQFIITRVTTACRVLYFWSAVCCSIQAVFSQHFTSVVWSLAGVSLCVRTLVALSLSPSTSCRRFTLSSGLSVICLLTVHRSWLFPNLLVSSVSLIPIGIISPSDIDFHYVRKLVLLSWCKCWPHKSFQVVSWCLLWTHCCIWTKAFRRMEFLSILRQMGPQPFPYVSINMWNHAPLLLFLMWYFVMLISE